MATNPPSESITRIVLRELLRSPAVKQLVKDHLRAPQADPQGAVSELVFEDVEFSASVAIAAARNATDLARALVELGRIAEGLPDPILHALAEQWVDQLDPAVFAQAAAVWWTLFERLVLAEPARRQRLDSAAAGLVEAVLDKGARVLAAQPALARALLGFAGQVVWTALRSSVPAPFRRIGRHLNKV